MDTLSNIFSVLELDAEDDQLQSSSASSSSSNSGQAKNKAKSSSDAKLVKNEKKNPENSENRLKYKMPLVWIDLEMTGLNVEADRILEIACIITDGNLTKSVEGPDLVIHQSKECLDSMGEWCQNHHKASGLTNKVLQSTLSEREAEKQVIEFVKRNVGTYTPLLAGNSVYVDFLFLKKTTQHLAVESSQTFGRPKLGPLPVVKNPLQKYMPDLANLFSHVLVDVSSVKALCVRWYPKENRKAPSKENKHRALDDIRESITELKYYKENIFRSKSKK